MNEITEYRIQQIIDNGIVIQITLIENVNTEPISQKQLILDELNKKLDNDLKKQIMPLLESILKIQPTFKIKSYQHTTITITMPKIRYKKIGSPQVGNKLKIEINNI